MAPEPSRSTDEWRSDEREWMVCGLDPTLKAARFANYVLTLRKELIRLSRACSVSHPALVTPAPFEILDDRFGSVTAAVLFDYADGMGLPSPSDRQAIHRLMAQTPDSSSTI